MSTGGLDAVAAELLRLPPADFTAARNARADAADAGLGRGIRSLRKPTVAAWTINLLSHDDTFREALDLSAALREAQEDLDAAELARLGRQRRALVAALAGRAVELAGDAGVTLSAAARDEVERTLNAAIVDPLAAGAVASGRLVRPLDPGDIDADALAERMAGSVPGGGGTPPRATRDDLAERRAKREAERRRREAEKHAAEAERERDRLQERSRRARERADLLSERVEDLRRDLARVSADADDADAAADELETALSIARDTAREARRAADRAAKGGED
ncbi:transposase [Microbacterium radiodurans]|uniref:Transposase n=1 Tax=Microbacterium radiodurans TaxID=661398 RepID=A0A5J5IW51_9MICO|nr:transposase [Microbacterium radiodurans]KAA9089055.1 transposase [Microbacterium radiodurans]